MTNFINYLRYILYLIVFIGFSSAVAGSYEDFFQAVAQDDDTKVSQLIAGGFDANTVGPTGVPALLIAIRQPSPKVITVLLKAPGVRAEVRNANDESALMLAALAGMHDVCARLIALDADVNKTGWTPLHYAATGGHDAVIRLLLTHYAYIDAESPNQSTPLMMAAMYGSADGVKILLEAGADATLQNAAGLSALDFAQRGGRQDAYDAIASHLKTTKVN
jgi:ankyrin repeat protein